MILVVLSHSCCLHLPEYRFWSPMRLYGKGRSNVARCSHYSHPGILRIFSHDWSIRLCSGLNILKLPAMKWLHYHLKSRVRWWPETTFSKGRDPDRIRDLHQVLPHPLKVHHLLCKSESRVGDEIRAWRRHLSEKAKIFQASFGGISPIPSEHIFGEVYKKSGLTSALAIALTWYWPRH